jgi:uncharacterized membrane protein
MRGFLKFISVICAIWFVLSIIGIGIQMSNGYDISGSNIAGIFIGGFLSSVCRVASKAKLVPANQFNTTY